MLPEQLPGILALLETLSASETAVAELYGEFSRLWPEDALFWDHLVSQEREHALQLKSAGESVKTSPALFQVGRPIALAAIQTFIKGIHANLARTREGKMTRRSALFIARDIEQSILENRMHELLRSSDLDFRSLMDSIQQQTHQHSAAFREKIAALGPDD